MSQNETTAIAVKWLMYQHNMTFEHANEAMTGSCARGSQMATHRAEALDVSYFITDIIEVENGKAD